MSEHKFILTLSKIEHNQERKSATLTMHAKTNLEYFLNYGVFTNVCAIDPGVYIIIT